MKKFLFSILAVAALGLTSCKRDFTCTCKYQSDTEVYAMKNVKKKDAKKACDDIQALNNAFGTGTTCTLD